MFGRKNKELKPTIEEPFKGDLLDRETDIRRLTEFTDLIRNPYVLTLNSPWGSGKTSYVRMWHRYLQSPFEKIAKPENQRELDEKYQRVSVFFNAWKHDFSGVPMVSLFAEIEAEAKRFAKLATNESSILDKLKKLKNKFTSFCSRNTKSITPYITPAVAGISECVLPGSSSISTPAMNIVEKTINSFVTSKSELEEFRTQLAGIAKELRGGDDDTPPLYIFIDELDRCRPTYAIELLESIKHLFDVDGVLFILSTDREQLSNTVKSLYGDIDADGYLRRFIDYEYTLPDPDRDKFIKHMTSSIFKICSHEQLDDLDVDQILNKKIKKFIFEFTIISNYFNLKLRDVEKIFQISSLLFNKLELTSETLLTGENVYYFSNLELELEGYYLFVLMSVIKTMHPTVYSNIKDGNFDYERLNRNNQFINSDCPNKIRDGITILTSLVRAPDQFFEVDYEDDPSEIELYHDYANKFRRNKKETIAAFIFKNLDLMDKFTKIEEI